MRAKTLELSQATHASTELVKQVGDLSGIDVLNDLVLMASYIQPEKSSGGIYFTNKQLDESRFQGKVGLVLKKGPTAFKYVGSYPYEGEVPEVGDWVVYRTSDGWETFIRGVPCRVIESEFIKARIADPTIIY